MLSNDLFHASFNLSLICLCVSGKINSTEAVLIRLKIAANQNGIAGPNQCGVLNSPKKLVDGLANRAPIYGPATKPIPKAAPIFAKFLVRCSGALTSAITARATLRLPPVIPSIALATKSNGIFLVIIPIANSI